MFKARQRKIVAKCIILALLIATLGVIWNPSNEASVNNSDISGRNLGSVNDEITDNVQSSTSKTCPKCGEVAQQTVYAPIFDLPEASGSEIVFNCRSPHQMEVTPTFYTAEGTAIVGEKLQLQPAEIRYVKIKNLIPSAYRNQQQWGGISLSYTGRVLEVWAQLRLLGVRRGGSAEVLFTILNEKRSGVREAVWFAPQDGYSTLALGNSSAEQIRATLDFANGNTENVEIAPYATKLIRRHSTIAQGETVKITENGITGCDGLMEMDTILSLE